MKNRILVTYASKYGATVGIAEKIGEVLNEAGLQADVVPVSNDIDLSLYSAVIMGSSVYVGRWRPEAIKFLKEKEDILKEKDFWVFSSGPTGSGDPSDILDGWSLPRTQETIINRIGARSIKLFHGKIDPSKLDMLELFTVKTIHAETGDHRDWEAIGAWATSIAEAYQENV